MNDARTTWEVLHRGRKFDVVRAMIAAPDKPAVERVVVRHPGSVVVLPLIESAAGLQIVLIRNRRVSVGAELWELPAGTRDRAEAPEVCAGRELVEETGYRAGQLTPLGRFYTTPGMTDELMHAFVARDLTHVGQELEDDEEIGVHLLPVAEVESMIDRGEIVDAKTILCVHWARGRGFFSAAAPEHSKTPSSPGA